MRDGGQRGGQGDEGGPPAEVIGEDSGGGLEDAGSEPGDEREGGDGPGRVGAELPDEHDLGRLVEDEGHSNAAGDPHGVEGADALLVDRRLIGPDSAPLKPSLQPVVRCAPSMARSPFTLSMVLDKMA